jgi:hypothetical protein
MERGQRNQGRAIAPAAMSTNLRIPFLFAANLLAVLHHPKVDQLDQVLDATCLLAAPERPTQPHDPEPDPVVLVQVLPVAMLTGGNMVANVYGLGTLTGELVPGMD